MKNIGTKRLLAYAIDMIIILVIGMMFSKIDMLNPNADKYDEAYKKYTEYNQKQLEEKQDIDDSSSVSSIEEISEISSVEKEEEKEEEKFDKKELIKLYFDVSKYGVNTNIISFVITILYFVVFQYYNKGQTIGKRIAKIKVSSTKGDKLKFIQILLRALIINSILSSFFTIIFVYFMNANTYYYSTLVISLLDMGLIYASVMMIFFNKTGKGIHDFAAGTLVVSETQTISSVKEATYKEKNK